MAHPNKKLPGFPSLFLLLCLLPPFIDALDFEFSSFAFNQTYIKTEGDASFGGASIYLSYPKENSTGRALYHEAMQLWEGNGSTKRLADFTTHFSFQISQLRGFIGDGHGLAFVIIRENATLSPISYGGLLGMFESYVAADDGPARNEVVAVEFDTFKDDWDPTTYHIGIDVNSLRSKAYVNVPDGFMEKGATNVLVVYNSTTKNLSTSLTFTGHSTSYGVSYLVDLSTVLPQRVRVGFTASTRLYAEIHELYSWGFKSSIDTPPISPQGPPISPQGPPPPAPSPPPGIHMVGLVAGLSAGLVAVILISGVLLCLFRSRKKERAPTPFVKYPKDGQVPHESPHIEYPGPNRFSYVELSKATNNFDERLKLGAGGFGDVYQGKLEDSNEEVAVKRFRGGSRQGEKEYVSEINVISELKHKNLVQLKGWCHENRELILVYEFMSNRSLDLHLFSRTLPPPTWAERYKISVDLALVLYYLQDGCNPFVLHRDIKSSNIMLDSNFVAKLGDFGLARLTTHDQSFHTSVPAGTLGYLAPEIILSGKVSKAADIYSFGVVALEIASGRRSINQSKMDPSRLNLVEYVWDLYGKRSILEAVDVRLEGEFNQDQARRLMVVGLWCCHPDPDHRPSIRQVQAVLNFEASEPILTPTIPRPTYEYTSTPI